MHAHPRRLFYVNASFFDDHFCKAAIPEQFNSKSLFGATHNLAFAFNFFPAQER